MKKYTQLNLDQRYVIKRMVDEGFSQRDIAKAVGKSERTISRELSPNINKKTNDFKQRKKSCRKNN